MFGKKPKVSIVLHAVRSGYNVLKCVTSLLDQSVPRDWYEVIVVDDASTDDTATVLDSFRDTIRVIRTETSWGSSKSRNAGVAQARGEIVLFSGVDCLADKCLLEEHLKSHSTRDGIVVIGRIGWQDDGRRNAFSDFIKQSEILVCQDASHIPDRDNVSYKYVYSANMSLPKRIFLSVGGSDERLVPGYYSDTELGYRLERAGIKIIYNNKAVVYHSVDLHLSRFSERMIAVGRSAVKLQSVNPALLELSSLVDLSAKLAIFHPRILRKMCYLAASLVELLERSNCAGTLRAILFNLYEKQLLLSFALGYDLEMKGLDTV